MGGRTGRLGDKLLSNPDLDKRLGAIDELLAYSEIAPETLTDVSDPLIDVLGSDEATEIRAKAAETLGDEGYRNAIDPLYQPCMRMRRKSSG